MDSGRLAARAARTRATHASAPPSQTSSTQPCAWRFRRAASSTSAMTPTAPVMTAALGCAPLMPPRPEDT